MRTNSSSGRLLLRAEFNVNSYLGVDLKRKPGRLMVDSARLLALPGWKQNVIDLDAYGSPWTHWTNLLTTCQHSVTVFITWGIVTAGGGGGGVCGAALKMMGLERMHLPGALKATLVGSVLDYALASAEDRGFAIGEIFEAFPQTHARYIGLRMARK